MSVSHALDLSGVNPANLVADELHSVNEAQFRDYFFIVPQLAPFYVDNFRLSLITNGNARLLTEDVEYSFALPYVTGTRHTGKQMYGAVTLNNLDMNGILRVTYQTVGGDQVADRLVVLSLLADKAYNPRTTIWDILTNVLTAFPPVPHFQDFDNFVGQEALVSKLGEIRDAIVQNSSLTSQKIQEFLDVFNRGESTAYVRKGGDFIDGVLELRTAASSEFHAVNKAYVDENTVSGHQLTQALSTYIGNSQLQAQFNTKLDLTGGTVVGQIQLTSDPVSELDAVRKGYVDNVIRDQNLVILGLQNTISNLQSGSVTQADLVNTVNELLTRINAVEIRQY